MLMQTAVMPIYSEARDSDSNDEISSAGGSLWLPLTMLAPIQPPLCADSTRYWEGAEGYLGYEGWIMALVGLLVSVCCIVSFACFS